ncbi:heat shock protein HslJ [Methanolinea mesophila]|uniref:META domain-containing protein n=1 Tax=Methanolinea mesophila TaxID=547055 RepID=UPI001AE49A75|nr:META domain-containing protein [Methanolinea mesophila]MBP1929070.1 heat shock protein HslJ [Methanolinea mesophila]
MKLLVSGLLLVALILMLLAAGCTNPVEVPTPTTQATTIATATASPVQTTAAPQPVTQGSLTGVTWYLVSFNRGTGSTNVLPGTEITAIFEGNTVYGSAGCNQYQASYQGNLNFMSIGTPSSTKMSCNSPPGIMSQENYYMSTLRGASSFTINGDILTVYDSNKNAILSYTKNPGPGAPVPLTGGTWVMKSYVDYKGEIFTPVAGTTISLEFSDDGKIAGNAGCNNYFGTYAQTGANSLVIRDIGSTKMACADQIMVVENSYLTMLPQLNTFYIAGNELFLSDGAGKVTLTFEKK